MLSTLKTFCVSTCTCRSSLHCVADSFAHSSLPPSLPPSLSPSLPAFLPPSLAGGSSREKKLKDGVRQQAIDIRTHPLQQK